MEMFYYRACNPVVRLFDKGVLVRNLQEEDLRQIQGK
jgi:hypothetical protein